MNQESTDFAAYRFTPRTSRGPGNSCAVEHFAPHSEHRFWRVARAVVCLLAAAGIGAMLARGV